MTDIFAEFKKHFQENFAAMVKDADTLFSIAMDKDAFWNLYLDSFPEGTNPIFRERREYDCSCCRHFIKAMGNVAVIKNGKVHTMWEFDAHSDVFQPVVDALDAYLKAHPIEDMFISKEKSIGTDRNIEIMANGTPVTWEHFYLTLPNKFVDTSPRTIPDIVGAFRTNRDVFKGSLDAITKDAVLTVLELIYSNSLYRGAEFKATIEQFLRYKEAYDALADDASKDIFAWEHAKSAGMGICRIKNQAIGTLLVNISNDEDLNDAVKKYDAIMAPANYKRTTGIFSKKQVENAQKTIADLGYMDSLPRRLANLDDVNVTNVLWSNKDAAKRIIGAMDVFGAMMAEASGSPKKFDKVEEIAIEDFIANILPTAQSIEAYLENRHEPNMCSLIAPVNADAPSMFKWPNPFSWAYAGNVTDSSMRERVKSAGGKVDGDLRFSIQWNECGTDNCDLDAHCEEASGYHIYYGSNARKPGFSPTKGQLDVDIISPRGDIAVENITWANRNTMRPGTYKFYVHQFSGSAKNGFRAEIEFDGKIYSFDYHNTMRDGQKVAVAEVTLDKCGNFTIKELIPSSMSSKDVWNLKTNNFVPVSVVMYSPNYWDEQQGIGNKHYMFMLKDCINPERPNGFYNEFLKNELYQHKRVFEALGSKMAVAPVDDQMSGLGFSSTKRNELVVKVKGQTERIVKLKF